jgi:colicin import membrane protein
LTESKAREVRTDVSMDDIDSVHALSALGSVQKIVTDIVERINNRVALVRRHAEDERGALERSITQKRDEWQREQEEYAYQTAMKRRKEEDEYTLKSTERERVHNNNLSIKTTELRDREEKLKATEDELKNLRGQVDNFPKLMEKACVDAASVAEKKTSGEAETKTKLAEKDMEREREMNKLRVQSLEDTIKRMQNYIGTIERQLSQTNEHIQRLAVTALESSVQTKHSRAEEQRESGRGEPSKS